MSMRKYLTLKMPPETEKVCCFKWNSLRVIPVEDKNLAQNEGAYFSPTLVADNFLDN